MNFCFFSFLFFYFSIFLVCVFLVDLFLIGCVFVILLRFKPKLLFQKIRGKRLMFVGDSLNRNQWESMVCMVNSAVPSYNKTWYKTGSLAIFKIEVCN